jgi:hypothetical protein
MRRRLLILAAQRQWSMRAKPTPIGQAATAAVLACGFGVGLGWVAFDASFSGSELAAMAGLFFCVIYLAARSFGAD